MKKGEVEDYEGDQKTRYQLDVETKSSSAVGLKEGLFGRNEIIHKIIKSLTSQQREDKIIDIYGSWGSGKYSIGLFTIKYCIDRKFFPDGAINIRCNNFTICC